MAQQGRVEDGIAESTLQLLRSGGPRAVTIEAVAAHSGIAKTTIYRRHPNRRDMLAGVLQRLASPPPLDPQADAPDRLRWLITHAIGTIQDGVGLGGLAAMLTEDDPEFTTLFRKLLIEQRAALAAVIDASKDDGSMRKGIDTATLIDAVVGAFIAEYARTGTNEDGWQERLFDMFWPTVRATP
ncbi:TetR/AcrR family transcriptional regulator [Mycobacterium sp. TNTM28]|uniref:TetR/AcrR family transcriptional regulator n=1 Tax=[Mycobacterium] fortunisiensis TaxID=2600579 RepID=A0ABS6KJV2_9MYCO|nr:helix-turn-helix domain-containing protein [[Mycobacterium] fortunisiensis]MBU9763852.1 TetR/AcrR family transcriptional regulator [[Mycobacterium] fortunisiensis]